jgi:hypothetical protein
MYIGGYILAAVNATIQALLNEIVTLQRMERGKLTILRQGPNGPYYSHQSWENGKNVCRYVPAKDLPALKEAIGNYERFQEITQEYADEIVAQTRAERLQHTKKNFSRKSSSPRMRKSNS